MHHQHPHVGFELQIGQTYLFLFIFNDSPSHGECLEGNVTRQNDQDQARKADSQEETEPAAEQQNGRWRSAYAPSQQNTAEQQNTPTLVLLVLHVFARVRR